MKNIKKLVAILIMALALCACMKTNIELVVTDEKTATLSVEILMSEDMIVSMGESPDTLVKEFKSSFESDETVQSIEEVSKTIDGSNWIGIKISSNQLGSHEIGTFLSKEDVNGTESYVVRIPLDDLIQEIEMSGQEFDSYTSEQMASLGIEMKFAVVMPGNVTSNYGEVSGNRVEIDLLKLSTGEITDSEILIHSPVQSSNSYLYLVVIAGVIIVAGIGFFIYKKHNATKNEEAVTVDNQEKLEDSPTVQETTIENQNEAEPKDEKPTE